MKVAWIGLGNMGAPMARNLASAGVEVTAFDLSEQARSAAGVPTAQTALEAAAGADAVVTMLPKGEHVRGALIGSGVLEALTSAAPGALVIDCSTIAAADAKSVAAAAKSAGHRFLDAPVSGGTAGAQNGTLTFMVGGDDATVAAAAPLFDAMGARTVHAGPVGAGQAIKMLNNLMLAINVQSTCEAAALAARLGVDQNILASVAGTSTGDSWALRNYYPVAGVAEAAPSGRGFTGGFPARLMHKDLSLALDAAAGVGMELPLVGHVQSLIERLDADGAGHLDFSALISLMGPEFSPKCAEPDAGDAAVSTALPASGDKVFDALDPAEPMAVVR